MQIEIMTPIGSYCNMPILTGLSNIRDESGVTHMFHGCLGYHLSPARRGGAPLRCAQCCKCEWCKGIRSALQTGLAPCPHSGDAGSLIHTPGVPSAPAGEQLPREESTPAAWSLSPSCAAQEQRRGGWSRDFLQLCRTLSDVYLSPYTPHILLTPCLLFSFLVLFFLLLSLSLCLLPLQSSHWRASKDSPPLFLCLTLLQQLLHSLSLSLWVLVKYMLLALLALRILLLQVVCPTAPLALRTHNLNFILSLRHSFSLPFFVSNSCSILPSWERGVVSTVLLPNPCSPQSSIH